MQNIGSFECLPNKPNPTDLHIDENEIMNMDVLAYNVNENAKLKAYLRQTHA